MTEEKLRIARNTYEALKSAQSEYFALKYLLEHSRPLAVSDGANKTYIKEEELSFLQELLEYRREEMAVLEKEFADL